MNFTIQIDDAEVNAALGRLFAAGQNPTPVLKTIGEDIIERAKQRFVSATAPDGTPWAPNARSTIEAFVRAKGGMGKRGINKKGQGWAISKRPLQGESGDLARQFHLAVDRNALTVSHSAVYAAMQQFGGKKSQFPNLWGDIPARPFLPVNADGELDAQERSSILAALNEYLGNALVGAR